MKKLLMLMILLLGSYTFISFNNKTLIVKNNNLYKNVEYLYSDNLSINNSEEKTTDSTITETIKPEEQKVETIKPVGKKAEVKAEEKTEIKVPISESISSSNQEKVLETLIGKMTGYGPDCGGCTSGKTSFGHDIINTGIYYTDTAYGKIRIVSGDYSYPYGTIVRITNYGFGIEPIIAVVLDRGGSVGLGDGKHSLFDLLFQHEAEALSVVGTRCNVKFEILRKGW